MPGQNEPTQLTYQKGLLTLSTGKVVNITQIQTLVTEVHRETGDLRLKEVELQLNCFSDLAPPPPAPEDNVEHRLAVLKEIGYSVIETDASTVNKCGFYVNSQAGTCWVWMTKTRTSARAYLTVQAAIEAAYVDSSIPGEYPAGTAPVSLNCDEYITELQRRHQALEANVVEAYRRKGFIQGAHESESRFILRAAVQDFAHYPGPDCQFPEIIECGLQLRKELAANSTQ
ncbi:hypothetical protein [Comamonas thiooxydans]|uniref:hypothetical protein n=1 Tax=Comamonas thiooxydans TaxID=363952 RepID=UPI000B41AEC0|nr:hypothetical protein [Comamonas thiooxydans]